MVRGRAPPTPGRRRPLRPAPAGRDSIRRDRGPRIRRPSLNILFVANFDRDVGYAWRTIDAVYRRVGATLVASGAATFICYPAPGSGAEAPGATSLVFDYARTLTDRGALLAFLRLLRRYRIGILYFTDRTQWSWHYLLYRLAGVRRIIVHDRTSGERQVRAGVAGALKRVLLRVPGLAADRYVGVSDFVVRRLVGIGAPPRSVRRVYNGIDPAAFAGAPDGYLQQQLGVPRSTRVVFASGRAHHYKGFAVLIDAAAEIAKSGAADLAFAYCGDGPDLAAFRSHAAVRGLHSFHFLGRRDDVPRLLRSAAAAVVPSLWDEAFGLTVIEAMAAGVPVVATRVGGIPELVTPGRTGLLVEPGDAAALAAAIRRVLDHPAESAAMARAARHDAQQRFTVVRTVDELSGMLREML